MCTLLLLVLVVLVVERMQKAMAADWLEEEKGAWSAVLVVVGMVVGWRAVVRPLGKRHMPRRREGGGGRGGEARCLRRVQLTSSRAAGKQCGTAMAWPGKSCVRRLCLCGWA